LPCARETPPDNASGLYAVSDPPDAHPHEAAGPFVHLLLDRFGPARCLWGSDFSPAPEFVSFAETAAIPWLDRLDREEREQVMGGSLLELLRPS
jgi:predicted TIM-barrel fold metal-dependent hydrolase